MVLSCDARIVDEAPFFNLLFDILQIFERGNDSSLLGLALPSYDSFRLVNSEFCTLVSCSLFKLLLRSVSIFFEILVHLLHSWYLRRFDVGFIPKSLLL